jgi:hypothetical protein
VAARRLQGFVDSGKDAIGGVRRTGDVGVGEDRQQLGWRAAEDSRSVNVPNGARQSCSHGLQGFVRCADAIGLDEEDAKVALVSMRARELILEHRSHEAIVEETGRAVDDVKRLGLRVIDPDSTRGTEDRARGKR